MEFSWVTSANDLEVPVDEPEAAVPTADVRAGEMKQCD
jgi:hypothetical protein